MVFVVRSIGCAATWRDVAALTGEQREISELIVRIAQDNPGCACQRCRALRDAPSGAAYQQRL
jgi:hypothetical protein